MLHWDAFRKEPAIARLDWLFTPNPRSPEWVVSNNGNRPSSGFRQTSSCPGLDRLASGLIPVITGVFTPCSTLSLVTSFLLSLRLLAHHWDKLPDPFFQTDGATLINFRAAPDYICLVSGSFHLPLRMLFSFPSQYYFTIGFQLYLGLDINVTQILNPYSRTDTLDTWHFPSYLPLRGYHTLWHNIPVNFKSVS